MFQHCHILVPLIPWHKTKYYHNVLIACIIFKLQVWRHGCLSLSKITGNMKLIENGKISVKKTSKDIKTSLETIANKVFYNYYLYGTGTLV